MLWDNGPRDYTARAAGPYRSAGAELTAARLRRRCRAAAPT
ncbi:hypothetical protein BZL30_8172 [Mycobacterium kansasii]|uniref:Uncharacterized protein n=1 Tax=Mycobacterium kansasii TaxID=1768 RepID=A0A1V3WI64_MYCKA|nr:hypothetical protein BZL30_8172 [Mycobacterium kansasii]